MDCLSTIPVFVLGEKLNQPAFPLVLRLPVSESCPKRELRRKDKIYFQPKIRVEYHRFFICTKEARASVLESNEKRRDSQAFMRIRICARSQSGKRRTVRTMRACEPNDRRDRNPGTRRTDL